MARRSMSERSSLSGENDWVKNASAEVRVGFVRKVYMLLTVQLLITFGIAGFLQTMSPAWRFQHQWLMGLSMVVTIGTLCAMACCREVCRHYCGHLLESHRLCMDHVNGFHWVWSVSFWCI